MTDNQNIPPCPEISEAEKFNKTLKKANDSYLFIVIICCGLALSGVVYAVMDSVFVGLLIAIAGIVLYTALTSNLLYKLLGISYRSATKQLTVTALYCKGCEEAFIPARLIWLDVTELGDGALKHKSSEAVRVLHLPATLRMIGEDVFSGCSDLTTLVFDGSVEAWGSIECLTDLSPYEIICNDGTIPATVSEQSEISTTDTDEATDGTEDEER